MLKRLLPAFGLLLALGSSHPLAAQTTDKAVLLQGVGKLPTPVEPDFMATTITLNEQPEIILTVEANPDDLDQSLQLIALASSRLGQSKVLAFSTSAYFHQPLVQQVEVQQLLQNCLSWGSSARHKRVQVWGGDAALTAFLTRQAQAKLMGTAGALDPSADILLLSQEVADTATVRRIEGFVRRGGTLLCAYPLTNGPQTPARTQSEARFNHLLRQAGLLQSSYLTARYPERAYLLTGPVPKYLGIRNMLASVEEKVYQMPPGLMRGGYIFNYTLEQVLAQNPPDAPIQQRLRRVAHYRPDSLLVPTPEKPVKVGRNYSVYMLQHLLRENELREHPNPAYVAPAAASFPGAVPASAPRLTTELALPVRVGTNGVWEPAPGFRLAHGTGLYVPPGEKVVIYLAAKDSARRLAAQIGVHSDDLTDNTSLTREPFDLTRHFELKPGRTEIYSPYGGVLLFNIPDTTSLKVLRVRVEGAVQAPRFELGKTSVAEWQKTIRQYPAPWAELVSNNISLTVPSARIRTLDDPTKVLLFWDAVLATDAKLAALTVPRGHPERIIVDQQLPEVAYMFAAPDRVVVPNDESTAHMLDADYMWKNGSWGHFHELGHLHQFRGIDFSGLTEVSVNLYTMYVFDKLLHQGLYVHNHHERLGSKEKVTEEMRKYLADSPSFEKWKADPFLALAMYVQLIETFGWAPIEQVYRQYRQLPKSQYPATEAAKRDYWFTAISTATRRNLAPFFAQWKVPVGEEAAKAVATYPTWLPPEMQAK
ncbi:MAG TPA: M60 family metallopeptidase [Hymenobacter sp.]|uniref:M60 family metallopeptidase n=1 Tax=Hymenobacter sp. TaxID=1898978 RepID=UPI002D80D99F|nr:M60 family metallopeptidase [Hymenobacter sp.]HET9503772.1 M60 family metallopeptidase [Hymenobacter sp.]